MKKMRRTAALLLLAAMLLTLPALAATPGYSTGSVSYDVSTGKFTATYGGAVSGREYTLLVVEGTREFYTIKTDTIQYLRQQTAGGSELSFSFIPMSYAAGDTSKSCVVLLTWTGGETPLLLGTLDGNASGSTVTGTVRYQASATPATVTLYDSTGIQLGTTQTDATGGYTFNGIPNGTGYKLTISKPSYCAYNLSGITVAGDNKTVAEIDISSLAGDVNSNGTVNSYDLAALIGEFNHAGDEIIVKTADINGNEVVNSYDLAALIGGFNNSSVAATE